jgi:SSS family solute:Na+ symporter
VNKNRQPGVDVSSFAISSSTSITTLANPEKCTVPRAPWRSADGAENHRMSASVLLAATPSFGLLNWSIVIAYLAGMLVIGHLSGRKQSDARGYFLAERSIPIWGVVLSTVAAILSAATFIGAPQKSFDGDLTYMVLNVGGFIAFGIVAVLFMPRFYAAGTITIYGYLDKRYGQRVRIATSAVFICGRILASGARLFLASIPICLLLYHDPNASHGKQIAAVIALGGLGIIYSFWGGIRAVIWTDCAQIVVVVGAAVATILLLYHKIPQPHRSVTAVVHLLKNPGPNGPGHSKLLIFDTSWNLAKEFTLWVALFANMPLQLAVYGTDQDMAQRMLTAKSAWRGGLSAILAQLLSMCVVSLFMVIGLLLWIFYRRPDIMGNAGPSQIVVHSKDVYPHFLLNYLPPGPAGLAMAGLFAAAQGSTVSAVNAMASSAVSDLYWPIRKHMGLPVNIQGAWAPRIAVVLMGLVLIAFAIICTFLYDPNGKQSLLDFALSIMAFTASGMLAVFLAALLTPRGNFYSVLAGLITGALVVLALQQPILSRWTTAIFHRSLILNGQWDMPIALIAAFLVCISGSTRPEELQASTPA